MFFTYVGVHTLKQYGYTSMLFRTGRDVTNSGTSAGHPLNRVEDMVRKELNRVRRDRLAKREVNELRHTATVGEAIKVQSEEGVNMFR